LPPFTSQHLLRQGIQKLVSRAFQKAADFLPIRAKTT
jgi:hypothetical protein